MSLFPAVTATQPARNCSQLCLTSEPLEGLISPPDPKPHSPEKSTPHSDVPLLGDRGHGVLIWKDKQHDSEPESLTQLDASFEMDFESRTN